MNESLFQRIWAGIVSFSRRLADGVAQLTNWQFVLLGLLALTGAGILQGMLYSSGEKRLAPQVSTTAKKGMPPPGEKDAAVANSDSPEPLASPPEASSKQEASKEIRKETDGESRTEGPATTNSKSPAKSAEVRIRDYRRRLDDYGSRERHVPVTQIVILLFIVLLAVRITTRSRQRADKRVMSAEASAEMESLRRQVTEAQLQTLQAQVEPHFLFNTLAAVEHLTATDPPRAAVMLRHLIAFLRGSLPDMRELTTSLGREVDLCQSYLAIMQIRMEDRLKIAIDVPEALRGLSFPPMMLQSLVENAIKHGIEPKPEGGAIALSARLQEGRLRVTVADTGLGIAENAPQGIGLSNIRDRLKRLFGNSAALILAPNAPTGAHITIEIPHATPASNSGR